MAPSQHSKPKLSIKPKEMSVAEEPQRPVEGLPYASILKGYCGSAPCLRRFTGPYLSIQRRSFKQRNNANQWPAQGVSVLIQHVPAQLSESVINVVGARAP
jgi:hypothetical protein